MEIDLEEEFLGPLRDHLQKELEERYPKRAAGRGQRFLEGAVSGTTVAGDELHGVVTDKDRSWHVRMTLPLHDWEGGYSYIGCDCQRDTFHLEGERCSHMWAVQKTVLGHLEKQSGPDGEGAATLWDHMDRFLDDRDSPPEAGKAPGRVRWILEDPLELRPVMEPAHGKSGRARRRRLTLRALRQDPQLWEGKELQPLIARIQPGDSWKEDDADLFGMLWDLSGMTDPGVMLDDGRPVELCRGIPGILLREDAAGLLPVVAIDGYSGDVVRVFADAGVVIRRSGESRIRIAACDGATGEFLESLHAKARPVPLAGRQALLDYLMRLQHQLPLHFRPELAVREVPAESNRFVLRLTPVQPAGLRVEVLVQPGAGPHWPAGQGEQRVLDDDGTEKMLVRIRDLHEERQGSRRLLARLLPPEAATFDDHSVALQGDGEALDFVAALDSALPVPGMDVEVQWPEKMLRPYRLTGQPLTDEVIRLEPRQGRDWLAMDGAVEVDGQSVRLRELIDALKNQLRYIALPDGRWALMSAMFQERLERLRGILVQQGDDLLCPPVSLALLAGEEESSAGIDPGSGTGEFAGLLERIRSAPAGADGVPSGLRAELRFCALLGPGATRTETGYRRPRT